MAKIEFKGSLNIDTKSSLNIGPKDSKIVTAIVPDNELWKVVVTFMSDALRINGAPLSGKNVTSVLVGGVRNSLGNLLLQVWLFISNKFFAKGVTLA